MSFIHDLENVYFENRNPENAITMQNYMKNNFNFLGIKTKERRLFFNEVCSKNKEEIQLNSRGIALELFDKVEREFHYCAIELLIKQLNGNFVNSDIKIIEKLIINNSWWDIVDTIAKYLLGSYLKQLPLKKVSIIDRFSNSEKMWLNRSAILFQLSYKAETNFELLKNICEKHKYSKEFFIQKAIGWSLREYASVNPILVLEYVNSTNLMPLSTREAIRKIK